jgi:hypothetical protein
MVWRDLDYGVDASGCSSPEVWQALQPLVAGCDALRYANETGARVGETAPYERHYFVFRIGGWKLDVSAWAAGAPESLERFQQELVARLDDETRLVILRLKDAWHVSAAYPDVVGGFEIYEAVLDRGVRTLAELDADFAERYGLTR